MKNFSNQMQENSPLFSSPEPIGLVMPPRVSRGSFENVRLGGRNVGASMVADGGSGESPGSVSINIYINNDVQGVNNSVLFGSEVRMGDPGVSMWLEDLKMDRGFRMVTKKKGWDFISALVLQLPYVMLMLFISFLAYLFV